MTAMISKLTPLHAIESRKALIKLVSSGTVPFVPIMNPPVVFKQLFQHQTPTDLGSADILIWEGAIRRIAQSGWEAWEGQPPSPDCFCGPPTELWMSATDEPLSDSQAKCLGLEGEWNHGETLVSRVVAPSPKLGHEREFLAAFGQRFGHEQAQESLKIAGKRLISFTDFYTRSERSIRHAPAPYFYASVLCTIVEGEPLKIDSAVYAALLAFLKTKIVDRQEFKPLRQYRRQEERKGLLLPVVRAVVLRHKDRPASSSLSEAIAWSCQWMVKGHWRRLHTPRQSDGATMAYVQPYVKGPEDKPLKPPSESVYMVSR